MRKIMLAGNWKMNKMIAEAKELAQGVVDGANECADKVDVVLGPSFLSVPAVAEVCNGTKVKVAAQNCAWEKSGAYTGDVAPAMIKDAGCQYVILGHSERREYAKESDELINTKTKLALEEGLKVILCVGELLEEREAGTTEDVVKTQTLGGLKDITAEQMKDVVIAYEPVWAIGTGKTATKEQAQEVHAFIRGLLTELYSEDLAQATQILYGGSANPGNIADLVAQPDVDGGLVGGASLKVDSFVEMIKTAAAA